jgi:ribosomal protein S18 acetylase RimI-like enzyme
VDPDAWGRGFGQALLLAATDALSEAGFREALLWVHPGNERARAFYERFGWGSDGGQRQEEVLGVLVPEVRYRRPLGN